MTDRIRLTNGFAPVYNSESRVLILGSHPGVPSLKKQQYYGNPGNAFWRVVFSALNVDDPLDYQSRLNLLLANGIALWDVYAQVEREGSYDHKITYNVLNDFESLLAQCPIQLIIANGKTAYNDTQRHPIFNDYLVKSALSTSGLNNGREQERMAQWHDYLHEGLKK